jgi:hypothetical protein
MSPLNFVLLLLLGDLNARTKRHRIIYLEICSPQLRVVVVAWRLRRSDVRVSYIISHCARLVRGSGKLSGLLTVLYHTFRFCCLPGCFLQRPEHVSDVDEVVVVTVVVVVVDFTTVTVGVRFGVHLFKV